MNAQRRSRHSYAETIAILTKEIGAAGNTVFVTIDQAAAAQSVGLSLRPTTLIVFGNPKAGTAFMDACPLLGLDLPLKIQVWETESDVNVAFTPMAEIAARYEVAGMNARVEAIDAALTKLLGNVT